MLFGLEPNRHGRRGDRPAELRGAHGTAGQRIDCWTRLMSPDDTSALVTQPSSQQPWRGGLSAGQPKRGQARNGSRPATLEARDNSSRGLLPALDGWVTRALVYLATMSQSSSRFVACRARAPVAPRADRRDAVSIPARDRKASLSPSDSPMPELEPDRFRHSSRRAGTAWARARSCAAAGRFHASTFDRSGCGSSVCKGSIVFRGSSWATFGPRGASELTAGLRPISCPLRFPPPSYHHRRRAKLIRPAVASEFEVGRTSLRCLGRRPRTHSSTDGAPALSCRACLSKSDLAIDRDPERSISSLPRSIRTEIPRSATRGIFEPDNR